MARPRVFVTRRIPDAGLVKLSERCEVEIWPGELPPPAAEIKKGIANADALLSLLTDTIDADVIAACPGLKVISNFAVGYNNIDVAAASKRSIRVGNTPGVLTDATADCALALMLAAARRIVEGDRIARSGGWKTWEPVGYIGQDFVGKTVGVFGLGRIGFAFAQRCRGAFGMKVIFNNRSESEWTKRAKNEWDAESVSFDELLERSDFLSIHASLNDESKGVFNAAAFARMKPTAVLINTARGGIIVQRDLVAALKADAIFAAGLDVTDPEPPDPKDELLTLPNAVIAPHLASATVQTRNRMAELAAENILAALFGGTMPSCVNADVLANA